MGNLKSLTDVDKRVHLVLTSSNLAEIYVYDTLKSRCKATLESVLEVKNASSFKVMLELVNVQPNLADNWLFVIKYSKVKASLRKCIGIFESNTSIFLLQVDNYKDFKEAKEMYQSVNDLYLDSIRKEDVMDLLRKYEISPRVKDFVASSYFKEPEKVFALKKELDNGAMVETPKDVVKLCGESMGSVQKFALQLLEDKPKTVNFMKRSFKKRVSTVCDLCDTFGSRTAYNYIKSSIRDILYIKMLYLEGAIYDKIRELPDCFDEKKLVRYNYKLRTISNDIPFNRIMHTFNRLNEFGKWNNKSDAILFLYKYYLELIENAEEVA